MRRILLSGRLIGGLKPNSIIRIMNLIKVVVRHCVDWQRLPAYLWDRIKLPKAGKARTRILTQEEIDLIVDRAESKGGENSQTQLAVIAGLVSLETGMR